MLVKIKLKNVFVIHSDLLRSSSIFSVVIRVFTISTVLTISCRSTCTIFNHCGLIFISSKNTLCISLIISSFEIFNLTSVTLTFWPLVRAKPHRKILLQFVTIFLIVDSKSSISISSLSCRNKFEVSDSKSEASSKTQAYGLELLIASQLHIIVCVSFSLTRELPGILQSSLFNIPISLSHPTKNFAYCCISVQSKPLNKFSAPEKSMPSKL